MQRETWLISYDIADSKRLRRVERICEGSGLRVQQSVFVCELSREALAALQTQLAKVIDPAEDSIRFGAVCRSDARHAFEQGLSSLPAPASCWIV